MILSNEEKKMALKKLNKFLDEYKECFLENPLLYAHIATTFMYGLETGKMSDVLRSICEELGYSSFLAIDEYGIFLKHMKEDIGIDKDLLEVGCGYLPSLATRVKKSQKNGTVAAIDPEVLGTDKDGVTVIRYIFSQDYPVDKYDLIYGFYPCDATEEIIKSSFKNDKDIYIGLCRCVPKNYLRYFIKPTPNNYEGYLQYLKSLLEDLSTEEKKYEILQYPDFEHKIIKTYKPKNFY